MEVFDAYTQNNSIVLQFIQLASYLSGIKQKRKTRLPFQSIQSHRAGEEIIDELIPDFPLGKLLFHTDVLDERSESFVQPKFRPPKPKQIFQNIHKSKTNKNIFIPFHCDDISEPHVSKFVT